MKKLLGVLLVLTALIFTGCDNNKGPFTKKMENGEVVLYSGNKPAKGGVSLTIINKAGLEVIVSEIDYDKGIPTGNFKLYKANGKLMVEANGKWENEVYAGEIKEYYDDSNYITGKGKFNLPVDFIINYTGQRVGTLSKFTFENENYDIIPECLKDGEAKWYINGKKSVEVYIENGERVKYIEYNEDGTIKNENN